jgi:hypothetical protein
MLISFLKNTSDAASFLVSFFKALALPFTKHATRFTVQISPKAVHLEFPTLRNNMQGESNNSTIYLKILKLVGLRKKYRTSDMVIFMQDVK